MKTKKAIKILTHYKSHLLGIEEIEQNPNRLAKAIAKLLKKFK